MWRTLCRQRKKNWCSRIGLGLAICVLLIILVGSNREQELNCSSQVLAASNPPIMNLEVEREAQIERLAEEDPLALLKLAEELYQNSVRDYVCTFVKQERIDGHLKKEETIRVCFKEAPFSVLMSWQGSKGLVDKVLYVAKDDNTTMLIRPAGLAGMLVHTVRKDVHDPKLKSTCLRTPNQFGFGNTLSRIIRAYALANEQDLSGEYLGIKEMAGRECLVLSRNLPSIDGQPPCKLVTFLDKEYLLPIRIESYDTAGERLSVYTYLDVRFNLGLTDELFSPKANGLDG